MNPHFVTYFDGCYAAYGTAMIHSLLRLCPQARMTVLCFDAQAEACVEAEFGSRVNRLAPSVLEVDAPALAQVCPKRTRWEAYATHKALLMRWLLERIPSGEWAVFVDADLYFYADPQPLWDALAGASIAVSPHRFHPSDVHAPKHGVFNAGFLALCNDADGRACAQAWSQDCLAWCFQEAMEDGRYMNQGYLTRWPVRHRRVAVWAHPGHNVGPWNVATHRLAQSGASLTVDGQPLIFFHFSGIWCGGDGHWQTSAWYPGMDSLWLHQRIYAPYLEEVNAIAKRLRNRHGWHGVGSVKSLGLRGRPIRLPVPIPEGLIVPADRWAWYRAIRRKAGECWRRCRGFGR